MIDCCFTSTETAGLVGTGTQDVHLDFHTALELCSRRLKLKCCFTSTETVGLLGTGAQDVHLDFHTAPELCFTSTETVGLLGTGAQDGHLDFHTAPELYSQRREMNIFTAWWITQRRRFIAYYTTTTLKGGESERRRLIQELGLFRCKKGRHCADHTHSHTHARKIFFSSFFQVPGEVGAFVAPDTRGYCLSSHGTHRHSLVLGR